MFFFPLCLFVVPWTQAHLLHQTMFCILFNFPFDGGHQLWTNVDEVYGEESLQFYVCCIIIALAHGGKEEQIKY